MRPDSDQEYSAHTPWPEQWLCFFFCKGEEKTEAGFVPELNSWQQRQDSAALVMT